MEVRGLMARVCTILIPFEFLELIITSRINMKMRFAIEGAKTGSAV